MASEVFIPLTVGGGINTLKDFDRVLKCGADKVSVKVLPTHDKWFGVTYAEDKQTVIDSFARLVADGVYKKDLFSDLKK